MRSSKAELAVTLEGDGFVFRETDWGGMHVEIDTFDREVDVTPLLKGLPDNLDPTPHWGYIFKGGMHVKYKDNREEVFNAGDVFYMESGNTAIVDAGSEILTFSPEEQEKRTTAAVLRNLAELKQKQ